MKMFRMGAKDSEDIFRLVKLDGFDRDRFVDGFIETLPRALGSFRLHAQSFALTWNKLYPDKLLSIEELLRRASLN